MVQHRPDQESESLFPVENSVLEVVHPSGTTQLVHSTVVQKIVLGVLGEHLTSPVLVRLAVFVTLWKLGTLVLKPELDPKSSMLVLALTVLDLLQTSRLLFVIVEQLLIVKVIT